MPVPILTLYSEPYSPSGNVAADGVKRLLGAPRLDLLQTLVREAVQNSCDAAKHGRGPKVLFRIRRLTQDQVSVMRSSVLSSVPPHPETSDHIEAFLVSETPWVLEICDFDTTGLSGPTRADIPAAEGEHTDFVDFVRNVGTKRNTLLGGGTYGYGKSALYMASSCGMIIIDSETTSAGQPVRRLIAAQLGEAYDSVCDGNPKRFTGRHWWGRMDASGNFVDPVEGEAAVALASGLGLPDRTSGDTGTSIMIVAPQFISDNSEDVVGALQEALLWYFWPRMMRDVPESRRLDARIQLDGILQEIPAPEETAPLDLFCEAMAGLRRNDDSIQKIESQRPSARLGRLNIVKGLRGSRKRFRSGAESLLPRTSNHIAVMRPVELVVRYFDGDPLPNPDHEWAGVFVTSDQPDIEKAFADSEPPAHDDWQPDILPERTWSRTYVRVALSRIKEAAKAVAGGQQTGASGQRGGPSLAHIADIFGRALASTNGQGGGPRNPSKGSGGGASGSKGYSLSRPVFDKLVDHEGRSLALFKAEIKNAANEDLILNAEAALVLDGSAASSSLSGYRAPVVVEVWLGDRALPGSNLLTLGNYSGPITLVVDMPDNGAATVKASLSGASEQ